MCGLDDVAVLDQELLDPELYPEPLLEGNGHQVSKSPWGPDDEIGRLNWVTPESVQSIIARLDGRHVVRPGRGLLVGHAVVDRSR